MSVQLIITHGATTETAGQAAIAALGEEVVLTAQATGGTVIAQWQLLCWYAPDGDEFSPTFTNGEPTAHVIASGANDTPTATFTRSTPGPFMIELRTWPVAGPSGTISRDVREVRFALATLGDCWPSVAQSATLRGYLEAQDAAGAGQHNNVDGSTRGWATFLELTAAKLDAIEAKLDAVTSGEALTFSSTITALRSGVMTYAGEDESIVFTAGTTHVPGSMITVVFPTGSVTGAHTITVDDTIAHPATMVELDPTTDYVVRFWAESTGRLSCCAVSEHRPSSPTISSFSIDGEDVTVVFNMATTRTSNANWSLLVDGVSATLTYVSGSGTTTLLYTSSVAAVNGDTVTATATAPTGHASTATGLELQAFSAVSVTNGTAPSSLYYNEFGTDQTHAQLIAAGWDVTHDPAAAISCSGGDFITAAAGPCQAVIGNTFPADYRVTYTITRAHIVEGQHGFCLQYYGGNGVIVGFYWHTNGTLEIGTMSGGFTGALGGSYPAGWTNAGDHTIAIEKVGTTYTVYLDGSAMTPFTQALNSAQTDCKIGFWGLNAHYATMLVEAV